MAKLILRDDGTGKEFDLDNYLFGVVSDDLEPKERKSINQRLNREMAEIFYGRNLRRALS